MPAAPRRVVNEPSDGAYIRQRIGAVVATLAIAVSIFSINSNLNTTSERRKRQEKEWGQVWEQSKEPDRDLLLSSEFARRSREDFGVPDGDSVIRYPTAGSLRKENSDKIERGLVPIGWLPHGNERSEPRLPKHLRRAGLKAGWGLRYRLWKSTDLVVQLPFSRRSDCGVTVHVVTELESEI